MPVCLCAYLSVIPLLLVLQLDHIHHVGPEVLVDPLTVGHRHETRHCALGGRITKKWRASDNGELEIVFGLASRGLVNRYWKSYEKSNAQCTRRTMSRLWLSNRARECERSYHQARKQTQKRTETEGEESEHTDQNDEGTDTWPRRNTYTQKAQHPY